jgi:quercetin dioxygenase-like cupin family protein
MSETKIDFAMLAWQHPAAGVRFKAITRNEKRLRLVEFSREFVEPDWCLNGHAGYVLEGELGITFADRTERFSAGDGIFILEGALEKHKALAVGSVARLILVEKT